MVATGDLARHLICEGMDVSSPNQYAPQEVKQLADEISRYLQTHSGVADTLEGIAQWWILRQRLQEERNKVEEAMRYLCEQGVVEARELPDGKILYSSVTGNTAGEKNN